MTLGGENIFPSDIERVLESHPDVTASAVLGVPDSYWGEIVCAFVHRKNGSDTDHTAFEKSMRKWLKGRLEPLKYPTKIFWIGEEEKVPNLLPVSTTGKIEKVKLRSIACGIMGVS